MGLSATSIVIHLGPGGLTAVEAQIEREGVRVLRCVRELRPEGIDAHDAHAEGRWVRRALAEAGVRTRRAVIALDRHEVVIKRLGFDAGGDVAADLPGMVRLRMIRQLPFAGDDVAIDYVLLPDERGHGARGEEGGVGVLSAALPGERLAWCQMMARAAHLKLDRVALRCAGVATLLAEVSAKSGGAVMGVMPCADGTEFVIVEGGHLVFARRVEECALSEVDGGTDDAVRRIAVEARRTWMSYVVAPGARSVESAWVLGAGELVEEVASRCAERLELPCEKVGSFQRVEFDDVERCSDAASLALAGLALQRHTTQEVLDLAHPRRPPDRFAHARQLALAGVFVLLLGIGLWFTWLNGVKGSLERDAEVLREQVKDERTRAIEAQRELAQLDSLMGWAQTDVPWLSHVSAINGLMPSTDEALLERVTLVCSPVVDYERGKSRSYNSKYWKRATSIRVMLDGRAKDQGAVLRLRSAFVDDPRYVATPGEPDGATTKDDAYPRSFALTLRTLLRDPLPVDDADAGDGAAEGDGQ